MTSYDLIDSSSLRISHESCITTVWIDFHLTSTQHNSLRLIPAILLLFEPNHIRAELTSATSLQSSNCSLKGHKSCSMEKLTTVTLCEKSARRPQCCSAPDRAYVEVGRSVSTVLDCAKGLARRSWMACPLLCLQYASAILATGMKRRFPDPVQYCCNTYHGQSPGNWHLLYATG